MNIRQLLPNKKYVSIFFSIYLVFLIGILVYWAKSSLKSGSWLITQHASPRGGILGGPLDTHWCAITASNEFTQLSNEQRKKRTEIFFKEEIEPIADEQGYSAKGLKEWFYQTAERAETYPKKKASLSYGKVVEFRDFSSNPFPKSSIIRVILNLILSKDFLLGVLITLPIFAIPFAFFAAILNSILSKQMILKWKILIIILFCMNCFQIYLLTKFSKHLINGPIKMFHYYDDSFYISVSGTWTSDTKLANPVQTTEINCWKDKMQCVEATANISDGYLNVDLTYWDVQEWRVDVIRSGNDFASCVTNTLQIDRKNKVVTLVRATKQPKPSDCEGIQDEPIVSYLKDGKPTSIF